MENGIDWWFNPHYHTNMTTHLVIDKAGRVVIPKPLREELHLEAGDALEMESASEEELAAIRNLIAKKSIARSSWRSSSLNDGQWKS